MALECPHCGSHTRTIQFRPPDNDKNLVQQFWILLAAAALLSGWSAYQLLGDVLVVRETIQDFVDFILANPALQQPHLRDGVRMAHNASLLIGGLAMAAIIYIPIRYGWLIFRVHRGHPWTLRQVQILALIGIGLELSKNGALWFISMHNESIQFDLDGSPHFFISLALLWYSRLRPVQDYFSTYHLVRSPSPVMSAAEPLAEVSK